MSEPSPNPSDLASARAQLEALRFDNSFVRALPADKEPANFVRQVRGAAYSRVLPTAVRAPKLVAYSREVAALLGIPHDVAQSQAFAELFGGNAALPAMEPYAACYGGHQFGNWAGQLGDGRAISLGELINGEGQRWELQLKGAGPTPYSRSADGRAVLRSSVREFLCSEAMFHLGIPTTRALSLVSTGEPVLRDILYNGNAKHEPGAVVCRVAPSFLRFGNFELPSSREDYGLLKQLADYTIRTHYPELGEPSRDVYVRWFAEICRRTAIMVVHWLRVGFVHGVMNTDNMSILGLTIDYGPYGFLDPYDPTWTPNITDAGGRRYRYENQASIALWNLVRFANAIVPLVDEVEPLQEALEVFSQTFDGGMREMLRQRLGLREFHTEPQATSGVTLQPDHELVNQLFATMHMAEIDFTIFYRKLSDVRADRDPSDLTDAQLLAPILDAYYDVENLHGDARDAMASWLRSYIERVRLDGISDGARKQQMDAINPKFILRNYLAQEAIDQAEQGDFSLVNELLDVVRKPYDEQPGRERFAKKRPEWARQKAGCSMLSCSS